LVPEGLRALIPLGRQFAADFVDQILKMPRGDADAGELLDQADRGVKRSDGGGVDQVGDRLGAILAMVQSLIDPIGGKRLADIASNGTRLQADRSGRPA
jgi:hypothetical protein